MLLLYRFGLTEIFICSKPRLTRDETRDLQIVFLTTFTLLFFYTSGSLHASHIRAIFELCGWLFCSSLLVYFFRCLYERNLIHSASLSHFISLVHSVHQQFFLSSRGLLLKWRKRRLVRFHIQHVTRCLFERRIPVGSSEKAVSGFCLSLSLQFFKYIYIYIYILMCLVQFQRWQITKFIEGFWLSEHQTLKQSQPNSSGKIRIVHQ